MVIYVVKNASRPVPGELSPGTGQEAFLVSSGRIVTLRAELCKWFLRQKRRTSCVAIDKEEEGIKAFISETQRPNCYFISYN